MQKRGINEKGFPTEEGVYLAKGVWGNKEERKIDVYRNDIKGLCCFSEEFGSGGTGIDDETDCRVSVQNTGLEFITKIRDLHPKK